MGFTLTAAYIHKWETATKSHISNEHGKKTDKKKNWDESEVQRQSLDSYQDNKKSAGLVRVD